MTRQELSLLLYLETRAVDYGGAVDVRHMNDDDFKLVKRWAKKGYLEFGRIAASGTRNTEVGYNYWVVLSETAWVNAHSERRRRNERMWAKRTWRKTSELT